ncbi:glycosyltransferase family 2 protein [Xylophilus sp. GW821-FHT01B05]
MNLQLFSDHPPVAPLAYRDADAATIANPAAPPAPTRERAGAVSISCVVPCWNEARSLRLLLPELSRVLSQLAEHWEIVLVDDGSTDDTALQAAPWLARGNVRLLQLSRNFGKEAALTAGLDAARGEVVAMLDADMQHPPALLADMLAHWRAGADVVYAVRRSREDEGAFKRWGSRVFYALLNSSPKVQVPPGAGDFRLLDRRVVEALRALPERTRFMKGLYAWVGFDSVALPYMPTERQEGKSRFTPLRLLGLSIDGLTAFTTWPLRAVSIAGALMALPALLYGAYLTLQYLLYGHPVSGWTTIVVTLMFFFGVQMVSLGIVGEYIAHVFDEVKGRPLYLLKREQGRGLTPDAR